MNKIFIGVLLVVVVAVGGYFAWQYWIESHLYNTNIPSNDAQEYNYESSLILEKQLKNSQYLSQYSICFENLGISEEVSPFIKLVDGKYNFAQYTDQSTNSEYIVNFSEYVATDLDRDGLMDALVVLYEYCGGNSSTANLYAMINKGDSFENIDAIPIVGSKPTIVFESVVYDDILLRSCGMYDLVCNISKIKFQNGKLQVLETSNEPQG